MNTSPASRTILVTGGSSGIGGAIARAFAADGCHVVATGVSDAEVAAAKQDTAFAAIDARVLDVRDAAAVQALVATFDTLDVLVNCAGTIRRGATPEEDEALIARMLADPKEQAEHIMLVDLARNDVGRISKTGTVVVTEKMVVERYSHVMHITSNVVGQVTDDMGALEVLKATLPAGTLSGAPKIRAMEIIDELEPVKRGPYAGVVGYVDFSGNLDTALAIRTMFVSSHGAHLQAGAGIVADSIPEEEDLECVNKASAFLAAIPAARRMTARRREQGTVA